MLKKTGKIFAGYKRNENRSNKSCFPVDQHPPEIIENRIMNMPKKTGPISQPSSSQPRFSTTIAVRAAMKGKPDLSRHSFWERQSWDQTSCIAGNAVP
jgi:hypothetical protein